MLIKGQASLKDIFYYFQGSYRYRLYYNSKLKWLLRTHIREQIAYRIRVMNPVCYQQGSCIKCGCMTTALQMCDKPCDGYCYPRMLNKEEWDTWNRGGVIQEKPGLVWIHEGYKDGTLTEGNKHILYKETPTGYVQTTNIN